MENTKPNIVAVPLDEMERLTVVTALEIFIEEENAYILALPPFDVVQHAMATIAVRTAKDLIRRLS